MICDWCGHDHPRESLCANRPKWSRRGFLSLFGAGIAGMLLPLPEIVLPPPAYLSDGHLLAKAWGYYVSTDPADSIFNRHWLLETLRSGNPSEPAFPTYPDKMRKCGCVPCLKKLGRKP